MRLGYLTVGLLVWLAAFTNAQVLPTPFYDAAFPPTIVSGGAPYPFMTEAVMPAPFETYSYPAAAPFYTEPYIYSEPIIYESAPVVSQVYTEPIYYTEPVYISEPVYYEPVVTQTVGYEYVAPVVTAAPVQFSHYTTREYENDLAPAEFTYS